MHVVVHYCMRDQIDIATISSISDVACNDVFGSVGREPVHLILGARRQVEECSRKVRSPCSRHVRQSHLEWGETMCQRARTQEWKKWSVVCRPSQARDGSSGRFSASAVMLSTSTFRRAPGSRSASR